MKATVANGVLSFTLQELVESLSAHDKRELARQLVAEPELFAAVLECVADGSRYCGHFFSDDEDGQWSFDSGRVLQLREKLTPLLPDIARRMAAEALRQRNEERQKAARMWDFAWAMWHVWPKDQHQYRPELPRDFQPAPEPTDAEIDECAK